MVIFNEAKHSYINEFTREQYISVTTLLGKYKEPFEKEQISKAVAKKEGVTQQEVLDRWQRTNKESTDFGTKIHKVIEKSIKDLTFYPTTTPEEKALIAAFGEVFVPNSETLCEQLVYSHIHKIAGTADLIQPDGPYFDVFDMKTNKKFNLYSQYNKFLYAPLEHLMECEHSVYSLQLSMYAYLYSMLTGRKLRRMAVLYYNRDLNTFQEYPITYLKSEVINILNDKR